jgi:hypothetical protein
MKINKSGRCRLQVQVGAVPFGQMLNAFGEEKKEHRKIPGKISKKHLFDFSQRLWYITILR